MNLAGMTGAFWPPSGGIRLNMARSSRSMFFCNSRGRLREGLTMPPVVKLSRFFPRECQAVARTSRRRRILKDDVSPPVRRYERR